MIAAVTLLAEIELGKAGITLKDLASVKTHSPFTVNDIVMDHLMTTSDKIFNHYAFFPFSSVTIHQAVAAAWSN